MSQSKKLIIKYGICLIQLILLGIQLTAGINLLCIPILLLTIANVWLIK